MVIFPVHGFVINREYNISTNKTYIGSNEIISQVRIIPKSILNQYVDDSEAVSILSHFNTAQTFALVDRNRIRDIEVLETKIALSILYSSYIFHEYDDEYLQSGSIPHIDLRIGLNCYDNDDYETSLTRHYTNDIENEIPDTPLRNRFQINIENDISETVIRFCNALLSSNLINQMRSSLYLIYDMILEDNFNKTVLFTSAALESLLIDNNESEITKKISIRGACLLFNNGSLSDKQEMSTKLYQFYKLRCRIIHEGSIITSLNCNDDLILRYAKSSLFAVIKNIVIDQNINSINDIRQIVTTNYQQDGLENGFDYIMET